MCQTTKSKFGDLEPKVIKQASLEANSNSRLRNAMKDVEGTGTSICVLCLFNNQPVYMSTAENVVVALTLMVYMFPEARSKADSSHVIYFTKVCEAVNG